MTAAEALRGPQGPGPSTRQETETRNQRPAPGLKTFYSARDQLQDQRLYTVPGTNFKTRDQLQGQRPVPETRSRARDQIQGQKPAPQTSSKARENQSQFLLPSKVSVINWSCDLVPGEPPDPSASCLEGRGAIWPCSSAAARGAGPPSS